MKKEILDELFSTPGHKRLAEAMADPIRTTLKKGRGGLCIDCGMDLRSVICHPDDECMVWSVMES